jgi:hypothetical protein
MQEGEIEVDFIEPIGLPDITPQLAQDLGFLGVVDRGRRLISDSQPVPGNAFY